MTPKELDFIWRLNAKINSLDLFTHSDVGVLDTENSISLMAMSGGNEDVFMDGTKDKEYQMQVNAKSKNQLYCVESLSHIATELERLEPNDIVSMNGSFAFESISILSPLTLVAQDENEYFIYALSISGKITIYKGVV